MNYHEAMELIQEHKIDLTWVDGEWRARIDTALGFGPAPEIAVHAVMKKLAEES